MPDVAPRAIELAQVPVMALVGSQRHYLGPGLTWDRGVRAVGCGAADALGGLGAAARPRIRARARRHWRSATRRPVSERGMWDALDEGADPTENHRSARRSGGDAGSRSAARR